MRSAILLTAITVSSLSGCAIFNPDTVTGNNSRPTLDGALPVDFKNPPNFASLSDDKCADAGLSAEKLAECHRNYVVGEYLLESDTACSDYLQNLTKVRRDYSLMFGSLSTVFGGLGSAFTQASVARPLAALAGISSAERAEVDADTFAQQTAQVIISGIKNSRARTYNAIVQTDFQRSINDWPLSEALADVADYHLRCSLHEGITEASASINAVATQSAATQGQLGAVGRSEGPTPSSTLQAQAASNAAVAAATAAAQANANGNQTAAAAAGAVAGASTSSNGGTGASPATAGATAGHDATTPPKQN